MAIPATIADFWARIDKNGPVPAHCPELGPCWVWTKGHLRAGYGALKFQRQRWMAHRLAFTLSTGPIPDGLKVCHKCDNPICCNPGHLFLGTNADNHKDMRAKGRAPTGDRNGSRTHPERYPKGDKHPSHLHPERLARGDRNGSYTHPERRPRGERNGRFTKPERTARGPRFHPERAARGSSIGQSKLTDEQVMAIRVRHATGSVFLRQLATEFRVSIQTVHAIVKGKTWRHLLPSS